jgi:hypothetical protein
MLSRSRLPSVVHVVRSGEVLSHYDVEAMREIIKRVALRILAEVQNSVKKVS